MLYQEELRKAESLALWAGDFQDEDALVTYLAEPFEEDFGFRIDLDAPPEYACVYSGYENRRRLTSSKPIEPKAVSELLTILGLSGSCLRQAVSAFEIAGFSSTKVVVAFANLSYRPELGRDSGAPLRFVGNVSWSDGRQHWETTEKLRVVIPPFPKLLRHDVGGYFDWQGIVQLPSWKGFAPCSALHSDGWDPTRGIRNDGDLKLHVEPNHPSSSTPTEEQARAFQHLLDSEAAMLESVLSAVFREYPAWRENYFGEQISSDGGRTWQKGSELPDLVPPDNMPAISSPSDLRRLIRPGGVHVIANPKDGFTRVGFGFACKWDDEHGLGVSTPSRCSG
jgi:hypothetical protein